MAWIAFAALALSGCASGGLGKAVSKTLETVGLKEPVPTEQVVPLRLYAGDNLNAGTDKRPTAAVVKIYKLRSAQRFEQAPFDTFLDEQRERAALGNDLIDVSEVVLTPGTRHQTDEVLPPEVAALGVVALFRAPADNRWRLAFDTRYKPLSKEGITVGLHACAITTDSPALLTRLSGDPASLASVRCVAPRR